MSEDDRAKLAADIAQRIGFTHAEEMGLSDAGANQQVATQRPDVIKTAGEAIALIAGVVAATYLLGGLVLLGRLLFAGYKADAAVTVLGQLAREPVVTIGFVQVLGAAAVGGLLAMLVAAATGKPTARTDRRELGRAAAGALLAAAVVVSAAIAVVLGLRDGWSPRLGWAALAILPTWGALCTGWRALRLSGGWLKFRTFRILAVGVVFMLAAIPGTLVASALVLPQRVRLCLSAEPGVINGLLIAMTKDQAFLMPTDGSKRVIALPGDSIARADTGDTSHLPDCPDVPPPGNA
jgi:hypothetical protein